MRIILNSPRNKKAYRHLKTLRSSQCNNRWSSPRRLLIRRGYGSHCIVKIRRLQLRIKRPVTAKVSRTFRNLRTRVSSWGSSCLTTWLTFRTACSKTLTVRTLSICLIRISGTSISRQRTSSPPPWRKLMSLPFLKKSKTIITPKKTVKVLSSGR